MNNKQPLLFLLFVLCSCGTGRVPSRAGELELVLYNGKIVTLDEGSSMKSAIAVRGGRILAVGTDSEVRSAVGAEATRVDLEGRTVIPGLIDTHPHFDMQALASLRVDFAGANSIPEILARIKAETERHPAGTWIVTEPIGEPPHWFNMPEGLEEGRFPNRWDLDTVFPDHPVFIRGPLVRRVAVSIANSLALKIAGITRDTPAPRGVTIVKDESGEPTGVFEERAWPGPLVQKELFSMIPNISYGNYGFPEPGLERTIEVLKATMKTNARMGRTTIFEGHGITAESLRAYRKLHDAGALMVRIHGSIKVDANLPMQEIKELFDVIAPYSGRGLGDEWLKVGGVSGNISFGAENFEAILIEAVKRRLRVHAICPDYSLLARDDDGGTSFDDCISVFERVNDEYPIRDLRFIIYHCKFPTPRSLQVMKRLGIAPTAVTNIIHRDGKDYLEVYGAEVTDKLLPVKSTMQAGVPVALGSDLYPPSPLFGIWEAVVRQDGRTGEVIGPHEKLSREEALRAYTVNGAYAAYWEDSLGTLEPGKLADLVVLSGDIMTCPESEIKDLHSLLTIVGGKVTYREGPFESVQSTVN